MDLVAFFNFMETKREKEVHEVQLQNSQRLIEEQATANARCDAETAPANTICDAETTARAAEQQIQINILKIVVTYMQGKEPTFSDFMTASPLSAAIT